MKHHHIKSISQHFQSLKNGTRTAEVRYNDRDYHIGDGITFHELHDECLTGNRQTALVTYIDDFGCQFGYVNLSLGSFGCLIVEHG